MLDKSITRLGVIAATALAAGALTTQVASASTVTPTEHGSTTATTLNGKFGANTALQSDTRRALSATTAVPSVNDPLAGLSLVCAEGPCASTGTNSGPNGVNGWNGYYLVNEAWGIPGSTQYVTTAFYPNGSPYNPANYSNPGTLGGVYGSLGETDPHGQLPGFIWAGYNGPNANTDPSGVYKIVVHFMVGHMLESTTTYLTMGSQTPAAVASRAAIDPSIQFACVGNFLLPCGTDGRNSGPNGVNGWNGRYVPLSSSAFPGSANYVVQAFYPNGNPYPFNQYSNPGVLDGVQGNVGNFDPHGDPFQFIWSSFNGDNLNNDPAGKYTFVLSYETSPGHLATYSFALNEAPLP